MKLEWLRELSLSARSSDLVRTFERLAAAQVQGEAVYLDYDSAGWCLRRGSTRLSLDEQGLAGRCAMTGSVVLDQQQAVPAGTQAWAHLAALPVRRFGSLTGVLVSGSAAPIAEEPLTSLAEAFALLLEPFQELDLARQALGQFQDFSVAAVEGAGDAPLGHVAAVCQLTADLAEYLDMSPQARRRLWSAALYHDVGKAMLRRHGNAEAERNHPRVGAQFLEASGVYRELAPLVATHHERYDGTGFPDSLKGDQLSLDQWVLCLAEDLQEFLELNPHLGFEVQLGIFFQEKASGHHPDVIDALAGLIDSGRLDRLRSPD